MADETPAKKLARPQQWALLLVIGGVGLVALSFFWPTKSMSRASWSIEQARAYSEASAKLHGMSHEFVQAVGKPNEKEIREKFNEAKADYDALRTQLDAAVERPKHTTLALRVCGTLIAIAGLAILYRQPST